MTAFSRRTLLRAGALGGAGLAVGPSLLRSPATAATAPPAGLHLGLGSDAARTAVVSWSTPGSVAGAVVENRHRRLVRDDGRCRHPHRGGSRNRVPPGVLRGLQPDTRYRYRVRHRGAAPVTGSFRSAPERPRASVHASDGGVRDRWTPIVDRFSVDLVVNGHNHSYERTAPMRSGLPTVEAPSGATVRPAVDGTTYVLAGGGGQAAYPTALHPASYVTVETGLRVPEPALWSAARFLDNSLVLVDVTPRTSTQAATLRVSAVDRKGVVVDRVTLER